MCSDVGVRYEIEVHLDAPLGDRVLVDGACELPEYNGYLGCRANRMTVEPDPGD